MAEARPPGYEDGPIGSMGTPVSGIDRPVADGDAAHPINAVTIGAKRLSVLILSAWSSAWDSRAVVFAS